VAGGMKISRPMICYSWFFGDKDVILVAVI